MPLIWYRDYSHKTDDELRQQLAGRIQHEHINRAEMIRQLMARDAKRFWGVWAAVLALSFLLGLIRHLNSN